MTTLSFSTALLVAAAGVYAGAQNALAGGGSFITFPALLLAGSAALAAFLMPVARRHRQSMNSCDFRMGNKSLEGKSIEFIGLGNLRIHRMR